MLRTLRCGSPVARLARVMLPLLVLALVAALAVPASASRPAEIIVLPGATSAEGIAAGRGATFYAGDLFAGDIFRGNIRRGTAELFIDAPAGRQAVGMAADLRHDLLFVAGGFTGQGYVYDLGTGATVASYDFGDPETSIINDVTVTKSGAWFTDSFQARLQGADSTGAWLDAMKTNAAVYRGNSTVMKAVNAGEVPSGVIYHYYWYGDQAKTGENSDNTKLLFFSGGDPGAFVSVSGGGVLASSTKQQQAQEFLKFVTGPQGQQIVADTVFEYPIGSGAPANPALKPLSELQPPTIDPAGLNGPEVTDLMTQAGLL